MIRDIFRVLFDRPLLRSKAMVRKGYKLGACFYLGNTLMVAMAGLIVVLFVIIAPLSFASVCAQPIESENAIIQFFCNDWGLIDLVADGLFIPMFVFWGIINFVLMFFGRGQFVE